MRQGDHLIQLNQSVPGPIPCKCCKVPAVYFGSVDSNKVCLAEVQPEFPPTGILVDYYRCTNCEFIFTPAYDQFTPEEFRAQIYNSGYARLDPDYAVFRPSQNATNVAGICGENKNLRILDYGGGSGGLASNLREMGYLNVVCYDPIVPEISTRPQGQFDLIACFEVAEHSPTPRETFAEMVSMLKNPGMIFFSTLIQPPDIKAIGLSWWYAGPRNGHISLFSRKSMEWLAASFGYRVASRNDAYHMMVRNVPPYAAGIFR